MAVQVELDFLVDHSVSSPAENPQTSSSCLGLEPKKDRPTTARMGQQAAASIRNWILATRCHGKFFGRKTAEWPRNEPGTFQKGIGTARNGFRRVPERPETKLAPPPHSSPTPPPPSVGWDHLTKGGGRGGRARPRATNDALHAVRSSRRSLSLRHNV